MATNTYAGARIKIVLDGEKVAWASGFNITQEETLTPVEVLDQIEVAEYAETAHVVSFSINMFKVAGNTAIDKDLEKQNPAEYIGQATKDITILDKDNNVLYTLEQVKFEGGTGSLDARGVWSGTWNFRAINGFGL